MTISPAAPLARNSLLPPTILVPWASDFTLGRGYDYMTRMPAGSAVSAKDVDRPHSATSRLEYVYISDQSDLDRMVSASVEGSGSIQGIEVKASTSFTSSVRFSETSETLVFSWYSDCTSFDRITTPTLTAAATALSATDPDAFRLTFGDYFISGGLQRAEFHAVYQLTAMTKLDLLSFKASAAASSPDLFSASGSAAFTQAAASNHVAVSANVYHSESRAVPDLGADPNLSPAQVLAMFADFAKDHEDGWAVAELTHYSQIAPTVSREVPVPPSFAADRALLADARATYDGLLLSGLLPREAATALRSRATSLNAQIDAQGALYWKRTTGRRRNGSRATPGMRPSSCDAHTSSARATAAARTSPADRAARPESARTATRPPSPSG